MHNGLIHARRLAMAVAVGLSTACLAAGAASAATVTVGVNTAAPGTGLVEFGPTVVNIHTGDSVTWLNTSPNEAAIDLGSGCNATQFLGNIGQTQSVSYQFTSPGTYNFFDGRQCSPSSPAALINLMQGQVVVTAAPAGVGQGSTGPSTGQGSAALNATVSVAGQFKSVTLSASSETFGNCTGGSSSAGTLGFPNGLCQTPSITVTNDGTVPETLDIQGSNAVPSDNGTVWSLIAPGSAQPGQDQFEMRNQTGFMTQTPASDGVAGTLQPGTGVGEILSLIGPSASTDTSSSFGTTVTWTAV